MTHSTEDLILAAHVRELAGAIRMSDFSKAEIEWSAKSETTAMDYLDGAKTAQRADRELAFNKEWHDAHPISGYVGRALKILSDMADDVKRLRG